MKNIEISYKREEYIAMKTSTRDEIEKVERLLPLTFKSERMFLIIIELSNKIKSVKLQIKSVQNIHSGTI